MRKNILCLNLLAIVCASCATDNNVVQQPEENKNESYKTEIFADFEKDDTSPYYFRYGNKGSQTYEDYLPRWKYDYSVVDNPFKTQQNSSPKVLKYESMEAREYGIKLRFQTPLSLKDFKGVRLKIYQPENVIGKTAWKDNPVASKQSIAVKLLGKFNTTSDFRQDAGQLLFKGTSSFTEEGKWLTFTFEYSALNYPLAEDVLANGICGIAILPTSDSNTTLSEEHPYVCYIDDIELLK